MKEGGTSLRTEEERSATAADEEEGRMRGGGLSAPRNDEKPLRTPTKQMPMLSFLSPVCMPHSRASSRTSSLVAKPPSGKRVLRSADRGDVER